nr:pectinesterase family protein [uncultured Cellulosilyticum sp.]
MKQFVKKSAKKQASLVLTGTLVASSVIPSMGNTIDLQRGEVIQTSEVALNEEVTANRTSPGGIVVDPGTTPEAGSAYEYDFTINTTNVIVPTTYNKENRIETLYSPDGFLKINGNGEMYHHQDSHGLAVYAGNSFEVKVAGNAEITFKLCKYSKGGKIDATVADEAGKFVGTSADFQGAEDGSEVTFTYSGEATTLTFTMNGMSGESYLHGMSVKNIVGDVKGWEAKDFAISIGDTTIDVKGAATAADEAEVTVSNGKTYYALSEKAYINADLKDEALRPSIIQNNSEDVVESIDVNSDGEIVVNFKDQTSFPATYTIKVQDSSKFRKPGIRDVYSFAFGNYEGLKKLNSATKIQDTYTTDNGLLTIGKIEGAAAPYWHDSTHGIAINDGNYMEVPVAGNATVTFNLCQYGKGGTLSVTGVLGEGAFDSNELKVEGHAACDKTITYTYTGEATTLRFNVTSSGEAYLHGMTVKNMGELVGSPVANEQASMPKEMDKTDSLNVTPVGHRLVFEHANDSSDITNLTSGIGYYVFDARSDIASIEADIKISAIGNGSGQGIFMGLFDDQNEIKNIATVGIRGDGKIRNIYNKTGNAKPSAGSIDQTYSTSDTIHVKLNKNAEGWYSEVIAGDKSPSATIKFSNTELLNDINENVRYGFAFSNVNGTITNLTFKDEAGNVLYDQTDCYEAIGTAPEVSSVERPIISADRKNITVNWSGESCEDDEAYRVEISKDGGITFTTLVETTTDKSYTAAIDGDGEYVFRITGVCGKAESQAKLSPVASVVAPLESPVIAGENCGTAIKLSWNAVDEATSYEIYRKSPTGNVYTLLNKVSSLEYTDKDVINEEPYYYYVVAKSESNNSNPSNELLMLASLGREGKYVHEKEATEIFITKKSYDTVYKNEAVLEGVVDKKGEMSLEVNGEIKESVSLNKNEKFAFIATLNEGRNDVNLLFRDEAGKVTRQTFNFVYLTNYDIVVDSSFTGNDGDTATDGSGAKVYKTVQTAVNSVPASNTDRVVILVKEGNYREYLRVTSPYITLIGEDREKVNINYFDPKDTPVGGDTSKRCAIYVQSSATGFAAENLTFENTYEYLGDGSISNESADALRVDADQATFVNVKLMGYQDTLQANTGHQYFYKCYISGNVDYIYGTSQALFNDCDLVFRYNGNKNSGYITAPKTDAKAAYGYIFNESRVYAEEGCSGSKYLLARPWGADASATFINTYMSGIINKTDSYSDMSGNLYTDARFSEFYSYGDGYAINSNRPQISRTQAEEMLTAGFLGWDPYAVSENVSRNDFTGNVVTESEDKFIENEYVNDKADTDTDDTGLGAFTVEGYAQNVTGGGALLETSQNYYKVATAEELLDALVTIKKSGKASVIELTEDIGLGAIEIGDALTKYKSVITSTKHAPLLHPTLLKTGVSTLSIKDMSNLTIFSQNGSALKHVCIDVNNSSNVIFRNIVFDEIWEWDEATSGDYDRNDWDYMTIQNGSTDIWIDHCTFYKAYDGIVDVKKAASNKPSNVTISWSRFLPESESEFFDEMMDLLEADPESYPYYNELLTHYGMTKEQVRGYASAQKKTHLIGASDTEENMKNLQLTLANNYYKNSMDRMPRLRGGNAHVYNCIMDASDILKLRDSVENAEAKAKVVSNGAISTCDASVLLENTYINGIINAVTSGNGSSPGGYINAVNSIYYMNDALTMLEVTDNVNQGMILDEDLFISKLPYSRYNLYSASKLHDKVLPNTGAGVTNMSTVQWQKTKYNETVTDIDAAKECTVVLDYQGGNVVQNGIRVTVGGYYENLPTPTRQGYRFLGWFTAPTGGNLVTTSTNVTDGTDHVLYARWQVSTSDDDTNNGGSGNNGSGSGSGSGNNDTTNTDTVNKPTDQPTVDNSALANLQDISGHWAKDSITYVVNKGILKGISEENFAPNASMTRAMFATVLYRLSGEPKIAGSNAFKDVKAGSWYETAITWASAQGIVNGVGKNTFSPNGEVTREQMAVMLYNYIKANNIEIQKQTEEVNFKDQSKVAPWAEEAMTFMAQAGIMEGDNKQNCNPKAKATRAEVSTMLHRFMEMIEMQE